MDNKELISSGDLELYIAGLLPDERAKEISDIIEKDDEVKKEVEAIENIILKLSEESTTQKDLDFTTLLKNIITRKNDTFVIPHSTEEKPKNKVVTLVTFIGWAAAIVFLVLFGLEYSESKSIQESLDQQIVEKTSIEEELQNVEQNVAYQEGLLELITSEDTETVKLAGQSISPSSNVKVYWNTDQNKVVIDASTLPEAPEGMVYQVWSLKLEPLTPTSLGLLENYTKDNNLFVLENTNISEGFGITLEPAGGSDVPTLEKLYVLGTTTV